MSSSSNPGKRDSIEKVLREFDQRKETLEDFCERTKSLIEDCLKDCQLRFQSVQARVKRREKLQSKYLDPSKEYSGLDDITDLAALRVITYYDDELDRVVEVIKSEFHVMPEKSVDKRETDPDRFGYRAINLVCTHSERRKSDVQFKKHRDIVFEIQVTSVLGHAWSEIEHEWYDLKETYPLEIKRRFYRLAALIELADTEFVNLRDQRTSYTRSVGVRVEADVPDVVVDAVSLGAFAAREPIVERLDNEISEIFGRPLSHGTDPGTEIRARASNSVGLTTIQNLRDSLNKHAAEILEFARLSMPVWADERRTGAPISRGVCIYQLSMMLAAAEGEGALVDMFQSIGFAPPTPKLRPLVEIARQVLGKDGK